MTVSLDEGTENVATQHILIVFLLLLGLGCLLNKMIFRIFGAVIELTLERRAVLRAVFKTAINEGTAFYLFEIEMTLVEHDIGKGTFGNGVAIAFRKMTALDGIIDFSLTLAQKRKEVFR